MTPSETGIRGMPVGSQLARFGLIGAFTVTIDFVLLFLLVSAKVHYLFASFVAFTAASVLNYWLSTQFVFVPGRFTKATEFTVFMVTTGVGLGLNQFLMWLLVGMVATNYLLAKCVSFVIVTCWNFISKKKIVFLR